MATHVGPSWGYSLLELVFATGIGVTLSGIAVPETLAALDDFRTAGATRYIASRFQRARMEAVGRSTVVALQFTSTTSGCYYAVYIDGNGNGVLSHDIQRGVDYRLGAVERLSDQFGGIDFGTLPGLPPVEPGGSPPGGEPIRLGAGKLASFTPHGTASSGSVYIRGRTAQYVVRVFGATGRTRVLKFDRRANRWKPL